MQVKLFHNSNCHVWKDTLSVLEEVLEEANLKPYYEVVLVRDDKDAQEIRFLGSPTIQINGNDIDSQARDLRTFNASTCRIYFWQGKSYESPPKEMILAALEELG